ncbi:MAG: DUF5329 family protein [Burkholderiales bacterium]
MSTARREIRLLARCAIGALCAAAPFAAAAPDAAAEREIAALLSFVATSPCRFVRGGIEYPGAEARDHLARKFESARALIRSADAFVDHVASASSVTGEPYRVRCDARESPARDWLRAELARIRRSP